MDKVKRPQFFALYKDFNDGKMKPYEVLGVVLDSILTSKDTIKNKDFCVYDNKWNRIPVRTKKQLQEFITDKFRYHFWAKCEWEFVAIDWPYRDTIDESRPVKIDVYDQLEPNIPIITDIVWNYIEPKLSKLTAKENE
jgi:hypothetical protein